MTKAKTAFFSLLAAAVAVAAVLPFFVEFDFSDRLYGFKKEVKVYAEESVKELNIYICGAVDNEGYYKLEQGRTYFDAVCLAGLNEHTFVPDYFFQQIPLNTNVILLNFVENRTLRYVYNVNSDYFVYNDVLTRAQTETILNYIREYGSIKNKDVLADLFGEQYREVFYKIFISEKDYAQDG